MTDLPTTYGHHNHKNVLSVTGLELMSSVIHRLEVKNHNHSTNAGNETWLLEADQSFDLTCFVYLFIRLLIYVLLKNISVLWWEEMTEKSRWNERLTRHDQSVCIRRWSKNRSSVDPSADLQRPERPLLRSPPHSWIWKSKTKKINFDLLIWSRFYTRLKLIHLFIWSMF